MDEKTKAEISLIVTIQDIMKTPDVPNVNKILHSTKAVSDFRGVYGDPQLAITRGIIDKTLQPCYNAIIEASGGDIEKIKTLNSDDVKLVSNTAETLSITDKVTKLNLLMGRMWLNNTGGPSLFGVGEIDKPEQTKPSPENFLHYVRVSQFHVNPELGQDCPDSLCKPFDPTKLRTVSTEQFTHPSP